jgi:hypothetical protein
MPTGKLSKKRANPIRRAYEYIRRILIPPEIRKQRVWPTEIIFFHTFLIVIPSITGWIVGITRDGWIWHISFITISLSAYWWIAIKWRRTGKLDSWWQDQVLSEPKNRFSSGVIIILFSTLHILIVFFAVFLAFANLLYKFELGKGVNNWEEALYMSLSSAGLKGYDPFVPQTTIGRMLSAINSFLGLVFTALWVAIFMKAFDAIFIFRQKKI